MSSGGTSKPRQLSFAVALLCSFASCRSSGDFRMLYEPDPVPRDARSGRAWFRVRIDSLSRSPARIGKSGPWIPPGESVWIDAELAQGERTFRVDVTPRGGEKVTLSTEVASTESSVDDEGIIPRPRLAGEEAKVIAGFHAAHHRTPGRRRALDLVPRAARALGATIESPVGGKILGVTSDSPDIPGGRPNEVIIRCDDGSILLFSHLLRGSAKWKPGQRIEIGDTIGRIGLSGHTSGPHLHLELLRSRAAAQR